MSVRTVAIVTSSRADYGHLYWPLRELARRQEVETQVLVTGGHLSRDCGHTVEQIEADGFSIADRIPCLVGRDDDAGMTQSLGRAMTGFGESLDRLRPDLLVVIADRYEMLAPAAAALTLRIPIVHIEGGERSEGAIDQAVRDAITAMAHVHLTTTEQARRTLIERGEEPWRVHRVGAASLDHLRRSPEVPRSELESRVGIDLSRPTILAAYHPVTLDDDPAAAVAEVLAGLDGRPEQIVFCYPNADAGRYRILDDISKFTDTRANTRLVVNLDPAAYWSLLRHVDLMYGNSSSGIMESPSLGIPAVNIGRRQQGREQAANVIDAEPVRETLRLAIDHARADEFRATAQTVTNPYGDGRAAGRIAEVLATVRVDSRLLEKRTGSGEQATGTHPIAG
jgi:UDP-N-acetylglucosamine 2-epimerase (non-hydrolysing)/GDP/UDP-N,N'-diacetylbacillosamine 2-epimerase (hydrolysing)